MKRKIEYCKDSHAKLEIADSIQIQHSHNQYTGFRLLDPISGTNADDLPKLYGCRAYLASIKNNNKGLPADAIAALDEAIAEDDAHIEAVERRANSWCSIQ